MKIESVAVFQPKRTGWEAFFLLAAILSKFATPVSASEIDSLLTQARWLYYESLKDKTKLDPTIALFKKIGRLDANLSGRTQTYIGSLTAVKAKYAFWPHQKWKWAKRGLQIMDEGLAQNPSDVEALFIHGMTCYYLPKFFGRSDDAHRHFHEIVRILPERANNYDPKLIANVIKFLLDKIKLADAEREHLMRLNTGLAKK